MVARSLAATFLLPLLASRAACQQNFTIANGQIYTPGFAVVDAPQPGTPLGGPQMEVALDVTANGILPLGVGAESPSRINNITIFLYSYDTGRNLTVSNGTSTLGTYGPIMQQEAGSTVKHVRWTWPACLAGDGQPRTADSDRGIYNISIRQNFRLNNTDYYTVFDLPISVTNSIDASTATTDCDSIDNPLLVPAAAQAGVPVMFAPGDAQAVEFKLGDEDDTAGQGLGSAGTRSWGRSSVWMHGPLLAVAFLL